MEENTYQYYLPDHGEDETDATEFGSRWGKDSLRWVAQDAAEEHHSEHDGWEHNWPLLFVILDENGDELGRFNVERETRPEFHATEVK